MLYAALTAACAMPVGNASSHTAGATPAAPAFIALSGPPHADYVHDGSGGHRSRIYVTSDDDGDTLVVRIRIPGLLDTVVTLTVAAALAAAVILLRRRRAARRLTGGRPASASVQASGTSVQKPPAEQPDAAATEEGTGQADAATGAGLTTGEDMRTAPTPAAAGNTAADDPARNGNGNTPAAAGMQPLGTGVYVSGNDRHMLRLLDKFIAEHISEVNLKVDDMAAAVYMSRSNLFRRLKSIYGITPNEYLRNKRLLYAAELLRQDQYTVSDICFMVGFNSPSYFASCFKKHFGILPTQYVREE